MCAYVVATPLLLITYDLFSFRLLAMCVGL
jgi:hypothetical protein